MQPLTIFAQSFTLETSFYCISCELWTSITSFCTVLIVSLLVLISLRFISFTDTVISIIAESTTGVYYYLSLCHCCFTIFTTIIAFFIIRESNACRKIFVAKILAFYLVAAYLCCNLALFFTRHFLSTKKSVDTNWHQ